MERQFKYCCLFLQKEVRVHQETNGLSPSSVGKILDNVDVDQLVDHSAWEKIIAGGWNEMADRFIEIYEVLFDASSSKPMAL